MKRILPVLLIVCLLLCACAQNGPEQTTAPVTTAAVTEAPTTEAATTAATEETTVPETTEATEPPVVIAYRNPLNGQPVEEPFTARPYTVIINNISDAQPMCGLSNADFLFEVLAEGGITRCLGVFSDISGLDHIGAIRSARPYFVELANSFDSIFVHHGGSKDGYAEIRNLGIDDIDALGRGNAAFYRDQDRLDNGYSLEHTSFADGDDILEEVADLEFTTHREEGVDYGFTFDDVASTAAGETATKLTVNFRGYGKTTRFTYNEEMGAYGAEQYSEGVIDGNTGDAVYFRNVLMMTVDTYAYAGSLLEMDMVGEGTGYFASNGQMVPIKWSRADNLAPFAFTHEDGTPITLGVGSTYVAITPLDSGMDYE